MDLIRDGMTVREARELVGRTAPEQRAIDTAPVTPERVRQAIASDPGLAREIVRDPQVASRLDAALGEQTKQERRELPVPSRTRTHLDTGVVLRSVLILSMEAKSVLKDAEALAGMDEAAKQATRRVLADVREALDTIEAIMGGEDVQSTIDRILAEAE